MLGKQYTVKEGDSLWIISAKYLGDPLRWPEIVEYNNQDSVTENTGTRINDASLIFVGQIISIPANQSTTTPQPGWKSKINSIKAKTPAKRKVYSIPFRYDLNDLPSQVLKSSAYMASIRLKGLLTLQPEKAIDFPTLTSSGYEVTAKNEADIILGKLLSDVKLEFNPTTNEIIFECEIFTYSDKHFKTTARHVKKTSCKDTTDTRSYHITIPDLGGKILGHVYRTDNLSFKIDVNISENQKTDIRLVDDKIPDTNTEWVQLEQMVPVFADEWSIDATIVEDIITVPPSIIKRRMLILKRIKLAGGLLLLFSGLYIMFKPQITILWQQNAVDEKISQIKQLYKINVIYKDTQQYIPDLWKIPPSNIFTSSVTVPDTLQLNNMLVRELKKYPDNILSENLTTIIVLGKIKMFNVFYAGTYLNKSVYIAIQNYRSSDYSKLSGTLHHEFSSILMYRYNFQYQRWSEINPTDFSYTKNRQETLVAIKDLANMSGSERLYQNGFLTRYNQATLENDFNRYAEFAFSRPEELKKLAEKYPRIRQKVLLLKEFYLGISKEFSPVMTLCCNV